MSGKMSCFQCSLSEICLPSGLGEEELARLDQLLQRKKKIKRGEHLFRAGDPLKSLYAIRTGFIKTYVLHEDGREQVTGFHMAGEIVGMDAISLDAHACDAVALEDTKVCEIPFARFEQLSRELPALQRHFHRLMSREIVRDHGVMLLLGSMRAEERVVALLLHLSQRYLARGYSAAEFTLRMTREEIGSYLGLKLETVSRAFSKLQEDGLIKVQNKTVQLTDVRALKRLMGESERPISRTLKDTNVYYVSF
jgi:CRP/FNR family transcriptional regulator